MYLGSTQSGGNKRMDSASYAYASAEPYYIAFNYTPEKKEAYESIYHEINSAALQHILYTFKK
jgi:hypothetical protein